MKLWNEFNIGQCKEIAIKQIQWGLKPVKNTSDIVSSLG